MTRTCSKRKSRETQRVEQLSQGYEREEEEAVMREGRTPLSMASVDDVSLVGTLPVTLSSIKGIDGNDGRKTVKE